MLQASAMPRPPLSHELERIRTLFLQMFVRAESMTQQAVRSIRERDPHMARAVMAADEALDALEIEIDRLCVRHLALVKPAGYELRLVTTVLKMVTDLERVGDLAVNIAERGLDLGSRPGLEPGESLKQMGDAVVEMIRLAADGFVQGDAGVHEQLRDRDEVVDRLNREAFRHWLGVMSEHPDQADRAMSFTSVSRYLERIADHAVALGQMIVLLVEGRDVRHR